MKTFEIKDIPVVPPVKITADLQDDGTLRLHTYIMDTITEKIVELQSQAIRESLLSLGWTTPETGKAIKNALLKMWDSNNAAVITFAGKFEDAIEETDPKNDILHDDA